MSKESLAAAVEWQSIYADNSDLSRPDYGIRGFAKDLFPDTIDNRYGFPFVHKEIYENFLSLYDPDKALSQERQLQLILWRGASKSTLSLFICTAYVVCFNGKEITLPNGKKATIREQVIVLASETNMFATNWSQRLRAELAQNSTLKKIFGHMGSRGVRDEEGNWTKGCFTALRARLDEPYRGKNCIVISRGVGQQIRGLNIWGRPTLVIADDLYSLKGILTSDTREKTRYWFNSECINTLDNIEGKVLSIGTVVHEDTVVVDHMNNPEDWTTVMFPVIPYENFMFILDNYVTVDRDIRQCSIPNQVFCQALEDHGYVTYWPEKFPIRSLLLKFRQSIKQGTESGFWQELFHLVISDEEKIIRKSMMRVKDFSLVQREDGTVFIRLVEGDRVEYRNVNIGLGMDCAISFKPNAANSAVVFVAIDHLSNLYVLTAVGGKWGINDEVTQEGTRYVERKGSVDEAFRVMGKFRPKVVIETNSIGSEVCRQFRRTARKRGKIINPIEKVQDVNKIERIRDTLSPYYQTLSVYHRAGQGILMHQLEFLGKTALNDLADAFATIVMFLRPPSRSILWEEVPEEKAFEGNLNEVLKLAKTNAPYRGVMKARSTWRTV